MRGLAIAVAVLSATLAGCYSSDAPLLTDANSVAPYAKATFREATRANADTAVMTRDGKAYRVVDKDGTQLTMRFMATDRPNWYVAQMQGPPGGFGLDLLYAVLKVDLAKREAVAYQVFAPDPKVATPGHHICRDNICIDDLKAYTTQAFAYADKGGGPHNVYAITVE